MIGFLKKVLHRPETDSLNLDDPRTTILRKQILRQNGFLEKLYREWYGFILDSLPDIPGPVVELGSGAGFLDEKIPELITSDMLPVTGISLTLDAHRLPFSDNGLRALVMVDVLHHLSNPGLFFKEADRCLKAGGVITMIEPWYSLWSGIVYKHFHHEPFNTGSEDWGFPESGPLSGANGAIPWIIFKRDLHKFLREYPSFKPANLELLMPFRYLLSGGMSFRPLVPACSFRMWRTVENLLKPLFRHLAMFAVIKIVKVQ